jgi:hypothetical protein
MVSASPLTNHRVTLKSANSFLRLESCPSFFTIVLPKESILRAVNIRCGNHSFVSRIEVALSALYVRRSVAAKFHMYRLPMTPMSCIFITYKTPDTALQAH